MGGNVFPGKNRRYARDEYLAVEEYLNDGKFAALFEKYQICPYLPSKETFGDMDVICIPYSPLTEDRLKDWFHTEYVKRNGSTWSLLYEELQIDLIISNSQEYDFCCNYHGVYDRGNFVGKIAHMLGLKFGHDGLWMPVRLSDSHKLDDILLTRDPRVAEDFLDIKPLVNPKSIEDIFENIIASKYFNPEVYFLENNNAIARVRDKKRPSYRTFLEYMSKLSDKQYFPRTKDKSVYLPMIFDAFPHSKNTYYKLKQKAHKIEVVKQKFNGDIVSSLTGVSGENLGKFMVLLKNTLSTDILYEMSEESIKSYIIRSYSILKEF